MAPWLPLLFLLLSVPLLRYSTSCLPTCMHYISIKIQFVPLFWQRLKQKEQVDKKKEEKKINFNWKSLPRTFSPLSLCCQLLIFFLFPISLLTFFFMPIFFFFQKDFECDSREARRGRKRDLERFLINLICSWAQKFSSLFMLKFSRSLSLSLSLSVSLFLTPLFC